ncbi:hypothetical protein FHT21_004608 [Pedobacter sp. SG908]|nr:hypothetical protein [Pedobacter sp. SG908]NMN39602.1 hypothetical protein [Pedobacter sp. SG918]
MISYFFPGNILSVLKMTGLDELPNIFRYIIGLKI